MRFMVSTDDTLHEHAHTDISASMYCKNMHWILLFSAYTIRTPFAFCMLWIVNLSEMYRNFIYVLNVFFACKSVVCIIFVAIGGGGDGDVCTVNSNNVACTVQHIALMDKLMMSCVVVVENIHRASQLKSQLILNECVMWWNAHANANMEKIKNAIPFNGLCVE